MKTLLVITMMTTTTIANAVNAPDYGYGYRHHGYYSLEQQQEAQRNQYNLQQTEQTQLDVQILNKLNGGQEPMFKDLYGDMLDIEGEE
jgi:hypothetical protein